MNIVLLSDYYAPIIKSGAIIIEDLAIELSLQGNTVTIVTSQIYQAKIWKYLPDFEFFESVMLEHIAQTEVNHVPNTEYQLCWVLRHDFPVQVVEFDEVWVFEDELLEDSGAYEVTVF